MSIITFAAGFVVAAGLAAWRPMIWQRCVVWVVDMTKAARRWLVSHRPPDSTDDAGA